MIWYFTRTLSVKNQNFFCYDIHDCVIGVDEVGEALLRSVVSCSVLLKEILENDLVHEIDDSKRLSRKKGKF